MAKLTDNMLHVSPFKCSILLQNSSSWHWINGNHSVIQHIIVNVISAVACVFFWGKKRRSLHKIEYKPFKISKWHMCRTYWNNGFPVKLTSWYEGPSLLWLCRWPWRAGCSCGGGSICLRWTWADLCPPEWPCWRPGEDGSNTPRYHLWAGTSISCKYLWSLQPVRGIQSA